MSEEMSRTTRFLTRNTHSCLGNDTKLEAICAYLCVADEMLELTADKRSTTHRTEKMFGPSPTQPTINTGTYVIQSTTTSAYIPATSTTTSATEVMTSCESVLVTSVPPSTAWLSPRSTAVMQVTAATRRVSDPMFSAAYSPLDRPLLAPPLRRPHRAPPSARVTTRGFTPTGRQAPTTAVVAAAGPESVTSSQTLPLSMGSRRGVSRSAEVLDTMDVAECVGGGGSVGVVIGETTAASAHSPFPLHLTPRRRAATISPGASYSDDELDEDDEEYESREPATMKLVRLQSEINDRKRRLHQLLRRVNSLERTHPAAPEVDRWYVSPPDLGAGSRHHVDSWDRSVGFPAVTAAVPRRYVAAASPQRLPSEYATYQPQRWTPVRAGAFVGPHHPVSSTLSRPAPRLYRSLSYDTDRDAFLSRTSQPLAAPPMTSRTEMTSRALT